MKSRDIRISLTLTAILASLSLAEDFKNPKTYLAAAVAGLTAWLSPSKLGAKKSSN